MSREFWTLTTKPNEIKRLNKRLIIPAFSAACGLVSSMKFSSLGASAVINNDAILSGQNEFTVEFWYKGGGQSFLLSKGIVTESWRIQYLIGGSADPGGLDFFAYFTNSNGTTYDLNCPLNISPHFDQWTHIAWTYSKSGLVSNLYVNGQLVKTLAIANFGLKLGSSPGLSFSSFGDGPSRVDDLRFWNVARTQDQIIRYKDAPRGSVDSANGLIAYWNFSEKVGIISTDIIAALALTPLGFDLTDSPMKYGASFIAAKASVANLTSSENLSLKFPLIPPSNVNFALAISWTDFQRVFQRRLLWNPDASVGNIDWAPQLVYYNGERLPPTFDFEIINIDGKATVDLASDYTIELSNTSLPNDSTDITEVSVGTLTIDKTLAQNFPLTPFPLTFNVQQTY